LWIVGFVGCLIEYDFKKRSSKVLLQSEMYIQEISIDIKSKKNKEELIEEFGLLMSFYRSNGQIQGKIETQFINGVKMVCLPFTLEKNSLENKYSNLYVKQQTIKIEELCKSKLEFKTVGKSYASYKTPCNCKKSDFYILITNYLTIQSPISCGNCYNSVPLYRLPKYNSHEYRQILSWEANYISCDTLQMNCEVGERWATNQMEDLNSELTKQGISICEKINELTNVPTFYYLHNYRKYKGDLLSRPCPSCNLKWDLEQTLHKVFDFKCDNCRLVSSISPNS
jgi:predicted  nucleic acid-binding Zn ribbon protein